MSGDGALPEGTDTPFGRLAGGRMRVLSWNLWWKFGPWEERQPAIAATIAGLDPDVVCLQETWREQISSLGDELGYEHVFTSRVDHDGLTFGNSVLSRWPITDHDVVSLPAPDGMEEMRTCLRADITSPHGPLQVFSTHLNWRFDHSEIRKQQVEAVCRFVADSPARSYPPVLCGDFNAVPQSDEIRMLTGTAPVPVPKLVFHDAWIAANAGSGQEHSQDGNTWSNTNPFAAKDLEYARRIDYVFVGWPKAGGRGQVLACEVAANQPVDDIWPSDHFAVLTTLRC